MLRIDRAWTVDVRRLGRLRAFSAQSAVPPHWLLSGRAPCWTSRPYERKLHGNDRGCEGARFKPTRTVQAGTPTWRTPSLGTPATTRFAGARDIAQPDIICHARVEILLRSPSSGCSSPKADAAVGELSSARSPGHRDLAEGRDSLRAVITATAADGHLDLPEPRARASTSTIPSRRSTAGRQHARILKFFG